jgi:hypothetical protein
MPLRHPAPYRGLLATAIIIFGVCAGVAPVAAQPKKGGGKQTTPVAPTTSDATKTADKGADTSDKKKDPKVKNFDFNALDLNGRMRTPQLLYFLERANEELERASLEKRSFIPHMVRSVEEVQL